MKPHPRPPIIRKTIKWGGAAVTALLVAIWVWSGVTFVVWRRANGQSLSLLQGAVAYAKTPPVDPSTSWGRTVARTLGWTFTRHPTGRWIWNPEWTTPGESSTFMLTIPLWIPIGLLTPLTAFAWWADLRARRRAKLNLCPECGYDRTGLRDGKSRIAKCPECGAGGAGSGTLL